LNIKYSQYWRKSGLKGKWGDIYLQRLNIYKPKNFLEIGVFCGVTALNTCHFLSKANDEEFSYTGIDLFGKDKNTNINEVEPDFLKDQNFSNPLKNFYYNIILKEKLNSIESVSKLLRKYKNNINLIQGDTNTVLKKIDLSTFDFIFVDGGHSYKTVKSDLNILYKYLKKKKAILLCDDYGKESFIPEVKKAIDDFADINNLKVNLIEDRFAEIIT
jgi:hypothetical protein|tara:strand:- start:1516 stop:2163 length:648 start_codon:yes stop_codon:yes gene_type:complete